MKRFTLLAILVALVFAGAPACTPKPRDVKAPKENVFRIAVQAKIPTLDPHLSTDVYSSQTEALFYETLYQYQYLKRPYELEPLLAETLPEISKDGKILRIKLKRGIRFHDDPCFEGGKGREVVAQDAVYMLERISAPKMNSPMYGSFDGKIEGIDAYHAGKAKTISGVRALDANTVEIRLLKSYPRFVYNFTDQKTSILAKECVEKYGDKIATHPVGTGPYKPVTVELGHKIIAVRNPGYHKMTYPSEGSRGDKEKGLLADMGKDVPFIDRIQYEVITESQPMWLKFMAGELEMSGIPKDNYGTALPGGKLSPELEKRGVVHYREARGDVTVMIFNMQDSVWGKNKDLRHAFALALNVPKIIEVQYSGQATRAHSIIDPAQYGFDPNYKSRWAERNVARAKELLAKAGYPDGKGLPPLVMPTTSDTTSRQFDELLTRQLAEVGIRLQSEAMTWPELERRTRSHNFTVLGLGYASAVPDADDATGLLHSKNIEAGYNAASYKNPAVDRLVDEIEAMPNGAARLAKIRQLKEMIDEDLPIVSMVHRIGNQLIQPWVKNHVYTDTMFLGPFLKYKKVMTSAP